MADLVPVYGRIGYVHLPPPAAPVLSIDSFAGGVATLSWTAVANATGYGVFMGTASGAENLLSAVTTTTTALAAAVSGLGVGPYYFVVKALGTGGYGQPSNEVQTAITATPAISPNGGSFVAPTSVSISDATAGAVIYYTTDGSTPTTSSSVYSTPFTLSASATVKALAVAPNAVPSTVAVASFTIILTTFWDYANSLAPLHNLTLADGPPGAVSIFQKEQDFSVNGTNTTEASGANNTNTTRRQAQLFPGLGASTTYSLPAGGGNTNSTGVSWPFGTSDVTLLCASSIYVGAGGGTNWVTVIGGNLSFYPGSYGISIGAASVPTATIWDGSGTPHSCSGPAVSAGNHLYALRRSGTELSLWVDGAKTASTTLAAGMSINTNSYLYTGYNQGGTYSNSLVFPEALSDSQLQQLYTLAANGSWLSTGFDPFQTRPSITVSNSQRAVTRNGTYGDSAWRTVCGNTFRNTGKRYAEFLVTGAAGTTNPFFGVINEVDPSTLTTWVGDATGQFQAGIQCNANGSVTYTNSVSTSAGADTGSLLRVAVDLDAGKVWLGFLKNDGVTQEWAGGGNPATGTTPTYTYTPGAPQKFLQLAASMYNAPSGGTLNATTATLQLPVSGFTAWDS